VASQQIEQFLMNRKSKEVAAAELARLRSGARIEYLNKALALDPKAAPAGAAPAPAAASGAPAAAPAAAAPDSAATATDADKAAFERGAAGLR
jgi:peptidyl-prolyl cis-trans isomerase C